MMNLKGEIKWELGGRRADESEQVVPDDVGGSLAVSAGEHAARAALGRSLETAG